jgi:hypothetical protein
MIKTFCLVFFCALKISVFADISAYDVIKKGDAQMRGNTSFSRIKIIVHRPRYKRTMLIDAWDSKAEDKFFLRVLLPKKDRGVTFLKIKNNLWQYIPKIGKEIKIETSLMQDSWMGSDFTNDDLVKQSSIVEDYLHTFEESGDPQLYRIVLSPKPGAPVVWGKIIVLARKQDNLPVKEEFYNHRGKLKKVMSLNDFKQIDGRIIPTRFIMVTVLANTMQSKTEMIYEKIIFNQKFSSFVFSKGNLRK